MKLDQGSTKKLSLQLVILYFCGFCVKYINEINILNMFFFSLGENGMTKCIRLFVLRW